MSHVAQQKLNSAILVAVIISLLGTLAWATHELLSFLIPPFDGPPDFILHAIMGMLKIATILAFPFAIYPLYRRLHRSSRNVASFVLAFVIIYLSLFVLYINFGRDLLADYASDNVVRFYYLDSPILAKFHYVGLEEWRREWAGMVPQAKEMFLMALCLTVLVVPGYVFGPHWFALLWSSVLLLSICVALPPIFGLVLWDYDTFLGGVFFDILSLDLIPPFWWWVSDSSIIFFALLTVFYCYLLLFCRLIKVDGVPNNGIQPTVKAVAE